MKRNILLVDDSVADVALTLRAMDDCIADHAIVTAGDGEEAYRLATERRFDLVLLDIKMPRVDGFELLKKLHERSGHEVPTIVVSGSNMEIDRRRARASGGVEYVHKAMDYVEFRNDLKAALGRQGFC